MEGLKIISEINPKLSLLNSDITLTIQITNELHKEITKHYDFEAKFILDIVYKKEEIPLLKEKVFLEDNNDTLKINISTSILETANDNDILNVSVLDIKLFNTEENFSYEKKFIVQIMKDKDNLYKNII